MMERIAPMRMAVIELSKGDISLRELDRVSKDSPKQGHHCQNSRSLMQYDEVLNSKKSIAPSVVRPSTAPDPFKMFFLQECERMNALLSTVDFCLNVLDEEVSGKSLEAGSVTRFHTTYSCN